MVLHRSRSVLATVLTGLVTFATVGIGLSGADAAPEPEPTQPRDLAARSASDLVAGNPASLHASPGDVFVAQPVQSVPEGLQYVPYLRTHKGLTVVGGDFVVVTDKAGKVLATSVAQTRPIGSLSLTPAVTADRAVTAARGKLSRVDTAYTPRLVVHALGTPRLAWEAKVDGAHGKELSQQTVYVDARSGKVVDSVEKVMTGTGTGSWSGPNLTFRTTQSGGTFSMIDPNFSNTSCRNYSTNVTFTGPDDVWGNGVASNLETGCVNGFHALQTQFSMLSSWLGRNGSNGNGGAWPLRVGLPQQNAFYNGSYIAIGRNGSGQWISSLDVVGHEYGHGIDSTTPGGISRSGTQEFVADVMGTLTEGFPNSAAQADPPDYQIGEEVNLVGNGPIRIMYNPSLRGHPNCYSSSIPTTPVHTAAGPGNHWFYLLAEGSNPVGKPASPTCNGTTVTGVGLRDAGRIMYNAMLMKTSSSSYLRYRVWTLQAAKNLFPGNSTPCLRVRAAWNAVSVPAQPGEPVC